MQGAEAGFVLKFEIVLNACYILSALRRRRDLHGAVMVSTGLCLIQAAVER